MLSISTSGPMRPFCLPFPGLLPKVPRDRRNGIPIARNWSKISGSAQERPGCGLMQAWVINLFPGSMANDPANGDRKVIGDHERVYYDGFWIRYYPPPEDSWPARKRLIDHLTRRTFHHTESGINTPGDRLEIARKAYESETDPQCKRVNAAMLAGALFNRATDIFTAVVNLAEKGVEIKPTNELMRQCGQCFTEALELGKQVRHSSGEEGIDELWGEPLKVFVLPLADYYESRYIKMAQAMRAIETIADRLVESFQYVAGYEDLTPLVRDYAEAARAEAETMRSDPDTFHVRPHYVAAGERLLTFRASSRDGNRRESDELHLIEDARYLISYIAEARVPMPKSTAEFLARCDEFQASTKPPIQKSS